MQKLTERQNRALEALKGKPIKFWKSARKPVKSNRGFPMNVFEALVSKGYATEQEGEQQVSNYMLGTQGGSVSFDRKVKFEANS